MNMWRCTTRHTFAEKECRGALRYLWKKRLSGETGMCMEKDSKKLNDIILELKSIEKNFGETRVLQGIDLAVRRGEFITLLGSSGCGKTTTLRIISGLETPDSGQVIVEGTEVTALPPNKRDVNTVFQNYALFPHMNVEQNIAYSLKIRGVEKARIQKDVQEMLELVQLEGYEKRMPGELSGGQRQRVAIARSLINKPKLLLLDEPLGALDLQLRRQMQMELKRLQKKLGITFIYITHDQEEALTMSDRIAVMKDGAFLQTGTPAQVYDTPETAYVATFVGAANIVRGTVDRIENNMVWFQNESGTGRFLAAGHPFTPGMPVTLALRGEQTSLGQEDPVQSDENPCIGLRGTVKEKSFSGGMLHILVELPDGTAFVCNRHGIDFPLSVGEKVTVSWSPENAVAVDLAESRAEA